MGFVITTRDPTDRAVSSWNWEHLIGGGDRVVKGIVKRRKVSVWVQEGKGTHQGHYEEVKLKKDPRYEFNEFWANGEKVVMPPYLVPNATEAPETTPADYMSYSGAVPTGPKPLGAHMYLDCFPQLPGGVSRWAEALDEKGPCAS